ETAKESRLPGTRCGKAGACRIEFEHVSFTYPGQEKPAVRDVTFSIAPNERVAFVGENGAGKSTIIKLMLGLYLPDSGRILIDGVDLREWEPDTLYQAVSAVFQDHREFAFSVAENVLMQEESEESLPAVREALEQAGLWEKVEGLSLRESTPLTRELSEEGADLSGGERQKLAIARAYAKEARLLVMDEPSSALDVFAESELFRQLSALSRGRTAVLITHRVISLQTFDRIFYIEAGELVECGPHRELIRQNGRYRKMYETQSLIYSKN
ncbi:MAG: ABC transporter ATP-binding protein, partial [Clostridiales bacterium]|nr:ABC transporter ATP-binding protein [Clostridiales bacterium]